MLLPLSQYFPEMAAGHVVRVPNSTGLGEILIHASSSGSHPLDLKLVATDGESPYVGRSKSVDSPGMIADPTQSNMLVSASSEVKEASWMRRALKLSFAILCFKSVSSPHPLLSSKT